MFGTIVLFQTNKQTKYTRRHAVLLSLYEE